MQTDKKYIVTLKNKILVCAYACIFEKCTGQSIGGEYILGWEMVRQLNRFYDVWVLTHERDRQDIEWSLKKSPILNAHFCYISLPKWLNFLEKFQGGLQLYIYFWQVKAYFVAKKLHKEINFNVFHHITYANDWMASFIGALLPIPYIRGPGGGAHHVPNSFLKNFSFIDRLLQYFRSAFQWIFRHDPFFIMGQNRAKAILVCNREAFDALPEKWRDKAYFFPVNGISAEDLEFLAGKEPANKCFSIITAGRLLKIKGFDLAIKAFKIFSDKIPEAKLNIIGQGQELKNLENLVSELKIKDKVMFKGWMSRQGLFSEMLSCDIFLFASLRDGGGAVVVEAMAAGKPVVCLDLAGPGFHIDEKCGIKIKPENPDQAITDMANALEKLYFNRGLLAELGKGAKEKAEKNYSWNKLGEKLLNIYKNILHF